MLSTLEVKRSLVVHLEQRRFHSVKKQSPKSNLEGKGLLQITKISSAKLLLDMYILKQAFKTLLFSTPPASFYLDMNWLGKYWDCYPGEGRVYHHTGPVNSIYALREALAMLAEEGLIACYKRHRACTERYEIINPFILRIYVTIG